MGLNLTSLATIQTSVQNQVTASRPYSVYWTENSNLQGWTTSVGMDIVGAWNGFLFATKRSVTGAYIGPTDDFPNVDTSTNDRIFFRMRYDKHPKNNAATSYGKIQWTTTAEPTFSSDREVIFNLQADQGFKLYTVDMNQSRNWVGLVNNIRFFPCEDGYVNDEFFLAFFEIGSQTIDFQLENPDAGSQGYLVGGGALTSELEIIENVNDRLKINIDGYGAVEIQLTAQVTSPALVARDIEIQLSKIAIGGYSRAQVLIDPVEKKLIIKSGTRASDSTVSVEYGERSAAPLLGLTTEAGTFLGESFTGSDPDSTFVSISDYRPTSFELLNFLDNSADSTAFVLDPKVKILEGGRRDYAEVSRNIKTEVLLEGLDSDFGYQGAKTTVVDTVGDLGLTFIDLNHPFTDDGLLKSIAFNGIAQEDGSSKWKIFRSSLGGTLTLISEGTIGERPFSDSPSGGLVLTKQPGIYVEDISGLNIRVRRGDLLALYNVSLHLGAGTTQKPDALYYEVTGDAQGTITPDVAKGAGSGGLPVYATGDLFRKRTVLDIDFGRRVNLDTVTLTGETSSDDLEYNISTVESAAFSVDATGSHTICYSPTIFTRICFDRNNTGFNTQALNDGIIYAENGVSAFGDGGQSGLGGADVDGATYFYMNGDGEFLDSFDFDSSTNPQLYSFDRDPFGLSCFFSSTTPRLDKSISRIVLYFKDNKNMRTWQIETAKGQGHTGGTGSISGFDLVPEDKIEAIEFDNKRVDGSEFIITQKSTATQQLLTNNPVILDVVAADGTVNPQRGIDFQDTPAELGGINFDEQATFLNLQWTKFQWELTPIRTTGFRWYCSYHYSTKISEFEIYASAPALESFSDNIQVEFSTDGENFVNADVLNNSNTTAEFALGNSPRYLRITLRPTDKFFAKNLKFNFENDQLCIGTEGRILGGEPMEDARVGSIGAIKTIPVLNNTGRVSDLYLDLPVDIGALREVLYLNPLTSLDYIHNPLVGGPGRVEFDSDFELLETENIAQNAIVYGLKNIAKASTFSTVSPELLTNGDFETGDLTGWNLTVTESGSLSYQIPRVFDSTIPGSVDYIDSAFSQEGSYLFGYSIDDSVAEQIDGFVPISFVLESNSIDISQYASDIDLGISEVALSMTIGFGYEPNEAMPIYIIGSPTLEGLALDPGEEVDASYGSNLLRTIDLAQSNRSLLDLATDILDLTDSPAGIKANTRYIKLRFDSSSTGGRSVSTSKAQKFLLDSVSLKLKIKNQSVLKWYKSWRTGDGDFTDASFTPITSFTDTFGSHHWYQPFQRAATGGVPISGQTQGYSNVFANDRRLGIQSFARMTLEDPGIIAAQWAEPKLLVGFRIGLGHNNNGGVRQESWPRNWYVQRLKTFAELGVIPDLENNNHYETIVSYLATGPWDGADSEVKDFSDSSVVESPGCIITTWLFSEPVETYGMRIVFKKNCDQFEKIIYGASINGSLTGADLTAFTAGTTCPANQSGTSFISNFGMALTFFQPLEKTSTTYLPIDNTKETLYTGSNVYAAVDLLREYAIDTSSTLFELISDSFNNTEWLSTNYVLSNTDTDDPNSVVWGNTSAQSVRWIRFISTSTERYEDPQSLVAQAVNTISNTVSVYKIPQAIIQTLRLYPDIQINAIHTVGKNCEWENLGNILTDNSSLTYINYSDYPVVAIDLTNAFTLPLSSEVFRPIHALEAGRPADAQEDIFFWQEDDSYFTYAIASYRNNSDPQEVKFSSFGTTAPSFAVRWVALKGTSTLRTSTSLPRQYNYLTTGGKLFNSYWLPSSSTEQITSHPSWFRTTKIGLGDVSSFDSTVGNTFTAIEGVDYGANATSKGTPYYVFDGQFSILNADFWTVITRDPTTGLTDPDYDFPHFLYRVFRDPVTFELQEKTIVAFKITGYNEDFYPTTFKLQKLSSSIAAQIPTNSNSSENSAAAEILKLDSSWVDITDASFTSVDAYQEGIGFTGFLSSPITAKGFRILITDSAYIDDSVATEINDIGGFSTDPNISSPQTRASEFVLFEEVQVEQVLEDQVDINHLLSASIIASSELTTAPVSNIKDGKNSTTWQSVSTREKLSISLLATKPIHRLEWEKDTNLGRATGNNSLNAPSSFVLRALQGGSFVDVYTETDFIGESFSVTLPGGPISAKDFEFEITKVQGEIEGANSVEISELRLIEEQILTSPLLVIDKTIGGPEDNSPATHVTYAANTDAVAVFTVDGMDAGADVLFSERDFFTFDLHINDLSLLDTSFGYIKLGNSEEVFYQWDISAISLTSGWNEVKLEFKNAVDRSTPPLQGGPNFRTDFDQSQVDFITEDAEFTSAVDGTISHRIIQGPGIRFFEMQFRGLAAATELEFKLHKFRFVRNTFEDLCKFNSSIYLNNSESVEIGIENLDISQGAVKFWLQPDWDSTGTLPSRGKVIPALFRIVQSDGKFINFFYRPGTGFVLLINDNNRVSVHESVLTKYQFERYDTFHIGVLWDSQSRIGGSKSSVQMLINGQIVYGSNVEWDADRVGRATFVFGGELSQTLVANPFNSTILTFSSIPTLPANNTGSVWGVIENLEVFNYPDSDFSHIYESDFLRTREKTANELIEISLDGINFETVGSPNLPLVSKNISAGAEKNIYLRTNIPKGLSGNENRDASILLTWRTPKSEDCN